MWFLFQIAIMTLIIGSNVRGSTCSAICVRTSWRSSCCVRGGRKKGSDFNRPLHYPPIAIV
jgi:hypothetical protein